MRTEVDHLNGVIVATGRRRGVETPVNAALVDIVHGIEAGDIKPDLALMRRLPTPSGTAARCVDGHTWCHERKPPAFV